MATIAKVDLAFTVAGKRITKTQTISDEGAEIFEIDLPAGITGTLTTRTSDTAGVLTVETGHGITASDFIGVMWAGGRRVNCDVSATTSTTITFSIGAGVNLPAADTEVVISKRVVSALVVDMNAVTAWGISPTATRTVVDLYDDSSASIAVWDMPAKDGEIWIPGETSLNPLDTVILSSVHIYNAETKVGVLNMAFLKSTM